MRNFSKQTLLLLKRYLYFHVIINFHGQRKDYFEEECAVFAEKKNEARKGILLLGTQADPKHSFQV